MLPTHFVSVAVESLWTLGGIPLLIAQRLCNPTTWPGPAEPDSERANDLPGDNVTL